MSMLTRLRRKFPALTPPGVMAKARIAIAKDVIANLDVGRMTAAQGEYFHLGDVTPGVDDTFEGVTLAIKQPRGGTSCRVCAIGAACVSAVGLYDKAPEAEDDWQSYNNVDENTMRDVLARYFSRDQLGLIECAFERSIGFALGSDSPRAYLARDFGLAARDRIIPSAVSPNNYITNPEADEAILRAIMQNIIKNDGTFRP